MNAYPTPVYLFTHPRTASNLLAKILNLDQQNVLSRPPDQNPLSRFQSGNFFRAPTWKAIELKLTNKPVSQWSQEEINTMKESYQRCFAEFESWIRESENQNKQVFLKEHVLFLTSPLSQPRESAIRVHGHCIDGNITSATPPAYPWKVHTGIQQGRTSCPLNQTVLPDEYLLKFRATFLIRHPALVFPSYYRAHIATFGKPYSETQKRELEFALEPFMTFSYMRSLYEFYAAESPHEIIILDVDDLFKHPDIISKYATLVGLDPTKVKWTWKPIPRDELNNMPESTGKSFVSTIAGSAGMIQGKTSEELNIGLEAMTWKMEFGETAGKKMTEWVKAAMGDYKFLKSKRLRIDRLTRVGKMVIKRLMAFFKADSDCSCRAQSSDFKWTTCGSRYTHVFFFGSRFTVTKT